MQADAGPPERQGTGEPGALRRWCARFWPWVVAGLAVLGVSLIELGAGRISPVYESTGTYIVRSRALPGESSIQATANLNDTVHIDKTFATIAESDLIVDRAWASLGSDGSTISDEVHASVSPRANILSISARTSQENVARDLAEAVGTETASFIDELDELYELTVLDPPTDPRATSSTDLAPGHLLAAGLVGLGLGAATRRLARRQLLGATVDVPELDTGIGNEEYTHQRLVEERARADSSDVPFHVLVLEPRDPEHRLHVPAMARSVGPLLREEDRLGHLDQTQPGTFVVIVPGRSDEEADRLLEQVREAATTRLSAYYGPDATADVQSCKYQGRFNGGGEAAELVAAL